jgi:hypothetical protein
MIDSRRDYELGGFVCGRAHHLYLEPVPENVLNSEFVLQKL